MASATYVPDDSPVPDYRGLLLLEQRVFIVLGAGQGIGRQAAHALAQAGAKVICVGRRQEPTEAVAAQVGGIAMLGDANVRADMERIAAETMERCGRIDGLVDILGEPLIKPLLQVTDEEWQWQFDASLRHAFLATQIMAPLMARSGGGSLVFVSSTSGTVIVPQRAGYASSKAALEQFVKAAAVECGELGVRINAVAPGLVSTPRVKKYMPAETLRRAASLYPLGKIGTPPQIASVILFLAGDLSAHVNGQTLLAEGGMAARSPLYELTAVRP